MAGVLMGAATRGVLLRSDDGRACCALMGVLLEGCGGSLLRGGAGCALMMPDEDKRNKCHNIKNDEPDERKGELEVHGGVAAELDDGVIGEKEDGREEIEEGEESLAEIFHWDPLRLDWCDG